MNFPKRLVTILRLALVVLYLAGCSTPIRIVPQPTPVLFSRVKDVLEQRLPTGTAIQIDAYYSKYIPGTYIPLAEPGKIGCPRFPAVLTDEPLSSCKPLTSGDYTCDGPTTGDLFLQVVSPQQIVPGREIMPPQLPYHARFSGHLGDPRLAHCAGADRIFIIDGIVQVYEEKLPTSTPEGISGAVTRHP